MNPDHSTVVRFVAFFPTGTDELMTKLVLGYGYKRAHGLSHHALIGMYFGDPQRLIREGKIYVGHLANEGCVRVFSGGNRLLHIPENKLLNKRISTAIRSAPILNDSVLTLFPLVVHAMPYHVLVAL